MTQRTIIFISYLVLLGSLVGLGIRLSTLQTAYERQRQLTASQIRENSRLKEFALRVEREKHQCPGKGPNTDSLSKTWIPSPSAQDFSGRESSSQNVLGFLMGQGIVDRLWKALEECQTLECAENLATNLQLLGLTPNQMQEFLRKISDHPHLYLLTAFSLFRLYQKGRGPGWEKLLLETVLPSLPSYLHFETIQPVIARLAIDVLNQYSQFFQDRPAVVPFLVSALSQAALNSRDAQIRSTAALSLGNLANPAALKTLEAMLDQEQDYAARGSALWSLGKFPPQDIEPFLSLLNKEFEAGEPNAMGTLARLGHLPAMERELHILLATKQVQFQGATYLQTIRLGASGLPVPDKEEFQKEVTQALGKANPQDRLNSMQTYDLAVIQSQLVDPGTASPNDLKELLWKGLNDPQVQDILSQEITFALAHLGDPRVIPYLEKLQNAKLPSLQPIVSRYLNQFKEK